MSDDRVYEIELDPLGYAPRPDLYARNLTPQTINFTLGRVRWSLPPWPNENYEQTLPWTVAKSAGFERMWARKQVLVAIDPQFEYVISQLSDVVSPGDAVRSHVFRQETPQAVTDIAHGLNRDGPVLVAVYSLDNEIEYWNFETEFRDRNTVRLSFDDPISFVATIL